MMYQYFYIDTSIENNSEYKHVTIHSSLHGDAFSHQNLNVVCSSYFSYHTVILQNYERPPKSVLSIVLQWTGGRFPIETRQMIHHPGASLSRLLGPRGRGPEVNLVVGVGGTVMPLALSPTLYAFLSGRADCRSLCVHQD